MEDSLKLQKVLHNIQLHLQGELLLLLSRRQCEYVFFELREVKPERMPEGLSLRFQLCNI